MISDEQLVSYVAGMLAGEELARFEQALAHDAAALRRLMEQDRVDAALCFLVGDGERETLRQSILEAAAWRTREPARVGAVTEALTEAGPSEDFVEIARATLRQWLRAHWRMVTSASAGAVVLLALVLALWPKRERERPDTALNKPARITNPFVETTTLREPALWPFASGSPWNTSIGAGAVFADVAARGMDLASGAFIVNTRTTQPNFQARPADGAGAVFVQDSTSPVATVRIPAEVFVSPGWPRNMNLFAEDQATVLELKGAHRAGEHDLRVASAVRADLRGSGVPPQHTSATGSGLPAFAGGIRRGELTGGIRHALGAVVPLEALTLRADGTAHVWPAAWAPTDNARWRQRFNRGGNVHLGTLLAIPPTVDLSKLGLGNSGPAFEIARALQDYGVYLTDTFDGDWFEEWQRAGSPNLVLSAELDSRGDLPRDLAQQLAKVVPLLKVVSNNGPQNIGGGGQPRRPAAPGFVN